MFQPDDRRTQSGKDQHTGLRETVGEGVGEENQGSSIHGAHTEKGAAGFIKATMYVHFYTPTQLVHYLLTCR